VFKDLNSLHKLIDNYLRGVDNTAKPKKLKIPNHERKDQRSSTIPHKFEKVMESDVEERLK
jgi:hypothetical protein